MRISDWSSDVCSSDLAVHREGGEAQRHHHRRLVALPRRRRHRLRHVEKPVLAFLREHEVQLRRPRLLVPAAELRQVDVPALLHRAHEILASRRLAVVARSEEHTSELQSLMRISYAVFCLKKKNKSQNSYS